MTGPADDAVAFWTRNALLQDALVEQDRLRRERDQARAEAERLRQELEIVGPRLETHHAAMAAGDLDPCVICGGDEGE